jgi:hypothetical protein
MRRIGLAWFAAALLASPAGADVQPSATPAAGPPLSVWRLADGGDAEHLQSGLACPFRFQGYTRHDLHVYDNWGLDVGCDYGRPGSDATVYLTRFGRVDLGQVYESAKRSFLQARANLNPHLRTESHPTDGGLAWDLAIYDDDHGLADMVWIGDLDGWVLEYRVTYPVSEEDRVRAEMTQWTEAVQASAGARLTLCAKSPEPARGGAPITEVKTLEGDAVIVPLVTFGSLNGAPAGGRPGPEVVWCVDHTGSAGDENLILWRGALPDGSDAYVDRITAMTQGAPTALTAQPGLPTGVVPGGAGRWVATITDGVRTRYYGSFTARPTPTALAALYLNILGGQARPLSSYDGHTVTISMPAK